MSPILRLASATDPMIRVVHPVVERLLTVGMDLAATGEGYGS